jgi:hypothetical protein
VKYTDPDGEISGRQRGLWLDLVIHLRRLEAAPTPSM